MQNNKTLWISIAVVVAFLIGGVAWYKMSKVDSMESVDITAPEDLVGDGDVVVVDGKVVAPVVKPTVVSMSYATALRKYEGKRFQFRPDCQAVPFQSTFKNGTDIMLDNRANQTRTIKIGVKVYTLPAYSFKIVRLSALESELPKTVLVDCNASQNVATILIQK